METHRQQRLVAIAPAPPRVADPAPDAADPLGWTVVNHALLALFRRAVWRVLHPPRLLRLGVECRELSGRRLIRRWRLTYDAVTSSRIRVSTRLALVSERQRLLDELERRYPRPFDEWLEHGTWATPRAWESEPHGRGADRPW